MEANSLIPEPVVFDASSEGHGHGPAAKWLEIFFALSSMIIAGTVKPRR